MADNLVYERVHGNMQILGLNTAESILDNWISTAAEKEMSMIEVLDHLLDQEVSIRRESAIRTRIKVAGFPVKKYIKDFDLKFQKSIDKKVLDELCTMRFVHNQENLIMLGAPGVGKTHLAIGLGLLAIEAGFSVYFINSADMIARMKMAAQRGNLGRKLKTLNKYKLLIIDEIGYLPFDSEASNLFFRLISKRYEHASTIFTSNKSYSEWGEVFGDPVIATAILDRILHHSITLNIKGDSYRLKKRKKAGLFPKTKEVNSKL
ncbi:MAG: ATP-binding protein [Candidatus Lokiarchaeota archaeon]|nr:ATP-binding protein [Candidatus Lokiarchaeota archaeon]